MKSNSNSYTRKIVFMGLICALAYASMFVLRIHVSFLTFDLKNVILAIGALIFGPVCGIVTSLVVSVIEMITISDTQIWGCLMNFLSSAIYVAIAGLIYKYKRTLAGAILGLFIASVTMTAAMIPLNLIITPIYTGAPVETVKEMIIPLLLPFNAIKAILSSAITLLIYKPVSTIFKSVGIIFAKDKSYKINSKTVILTVVSAVIIVTCIILFFAFYNGSFELYKK